MGVLGGGVAGWAGAAGAGVSGATVAIAFVVAFLAAQLAVRVALGLFGLVVAVADVGFGVVFLDPGDDMLGVQGDHVAEIDVGGQFQPEQLHRAVQQELGGRVVQVAEHAPELAARRHRTRDIETVGGRGIGHQRKAEAPDQGRVFEQVGAQLAHRTQALVELDQVGGHVGGAGRRGGTGPGVVGRPLGKMRPVERAEQVEILAGHRIVGHKLRQRGLRLGQAGQIGPQQRDDRRWLGGGCALPTQGGQRQGQAVASRGK